MQIISTPSLLASVYDRVGGDIPATFLFAAEIEFYLAPADESVLAGINQARVALPFTVHALEKEKGTNQYELQLSPMADPLAMAEAIVAVRDMVAKCAALQGAAALFASKPYNDEPGSSIHIHMNLFDKEGCNLFRKEGDAEPPLLLHTIGGLCATMKEAMPFFSPTVASYGRFTRHANAPTTISWGGNNRTTALRIPISPPENRRLEHRVPGAESDPYVVIAAMLAGMHYGIMHQVPAPVKIYGDAAHPQYGLEHLPATFEDALGTYEKGTILKSYFEA